MEDKKLFTNSPDGTHLEFLTWEFEDEMERRKYKSARKGLIKKNPSAVGIILLFFAMILVISFALISVCIASLFLFFYLPGFLRWTYLDYKYPLQSITLKLELNELQLTENYTGRKKQHEKELFTVRAKEIKSAYWMTDGLRLERNWNYLTDRTKLLPIRLFADKQNLAKIYEWTKTFDIEIDGIPPTGAYVRPPTSY